MRWGRTLLMIVIGLVALIVVALALAPSLLNLEQIKDQVVNRVEQQLNRDIELGQVRLELFSGLGAGLDQLTIANPKGWQSPHFVKFDTVSVKVALRPLLSRRIEVSKIILHTGEIVVERDAQGRFNYDDLTAAADANPRAEPAKPAPPPDASGESSLLAGLLVSKLALHDVDVKFIDRMVVPGEIVTTAARQVNLEGDNIGFNTPIALSLSSALLTDGKSNVQVRGRIGPIPDNALLDVQQIPLQLNLKVMELQLAPVVPYLGDEPMLTTGELSADIAIEGTLGDALTMRGQLALDQAALPNPSGSGQPTALPTITLNPDITVNLADTLLTMTEVRADFGALQTSLKGTVKQFDTPSPQFDLRLNTSNVAMAEARKQWPILAEALPEAMAPQGNIGLQATLRGTLERLHVTSQLNAEPLSMRLQDGTDLALTKVQWSQDTILDIAQSLITLNRADLDLGFLQTTVQGTIATFDSTPTLDLQIKTSNFDPAKVLSHLPMLASTLPQPAEVQGELQLQATLQGTTDKLKADAQITAPSLSLKSGSFHGGEAAAGGMHVDLSQMQTRLQTQLNAPKPPTVNVDLKAQRLVFDQQSPSPSAAPPASSPAPSSGTSTSGTSTDASGMQAPPINARGNLSIAGGRITGIAFSHLKAVFSILNGLVNSQHTVQMFGGAYEGTLNANLAQSKPDYQFAIKLANMQAGEVANTFTSTPNILFGLLHSDLKFRGKGLDWSDISTTITGTGKLNLTNFKLTTLDVMPKLAKGLSAASTIAGFIVPDDLSTRSFDKLKATLRFQDGKIHSDDLTLWGPDVQLLGKGGVGLDRSLAFDGTAVLLGKLAQSLGKRAKFLMDAEGRINIPLAIQGTVTQPRIALNEDHLTDLAQRALTQHVKKKAGKEVEKLLDQVLPSDQSGDQKGEAPNPLKELNKTIKGLLGR